MDARGISETSNTVGLIHRIKQQIDALSQEQAEALKTATYVGMSAEEAIEYDSRRERITELVRQLDALQNAQ